MNKFLLYFSNFLLVILKGTGQVIRKQNLLAFLLLFLFTNAFSQLAGTTWQLSPTAGALAVGPAQGDYSWWSNEQEDVSTRNCLFDDKFVFNADGSFQNIQDGSTWLEDWQGTMDACGTPVPPHNGPTAATWAYDAGAGTITLTGQGAHLGLAKAVNGMELANPADAPNMLTYNATIAGNTMTVDISVGTGHWQFVLQKEVPVASLAGTTWKLAPIAGALAVGPSPGDYSWWSNNQDAITIRSCLFDDKFVFNEDGSFQNIQDGSTWLEAWQGTTDACGTPVTPHDGATAATWAYDADAGTITLTGQGAHLGLAKVVNGSELSDPATAPNMITYNATIDGNTMLVDISVGNGHWQFSLQKEVTSTTADATLSDLMVDGTTVNGFLTNLLTYMVELPNGTTTVPSVAATANNANATVMVNASTSLPGTTTVVVTAADGTTMLTYNVVFTVAPPTPTTVAPTPTCDPNTVISIFSEAYTNVGVENFNPNWSQSGSASTEMIAGNMVLKYSNFNYQGTQLAGDNDLSQMNYLHLDMWTSNATDVKVTPINNGGDPSENLVALSPITPGTWVNYIIPLSDFTANEMSLNAIHQMKFDAQAGNTPAEIYLDNIYFSTDCGTPTACPPSLLLNQMGIVDNTYRAVTIESAGTVESGATVIFAASNSVTLKAGFHAKAGADFTAKIEACPTSLQEENPTVITRSTTPDRPITAVQKNHQLDIKTFPNPMSEQMTVQLQAFEQGELRLFDGTGKTHITRNITGVTTLNVNHLPAGIYFLQVLDKASGQVFTRKMVRQQ